MIFKERCHTIYLCCRNDRIRQFLYRSANLCRDRAESADYDEIMQSGIDYRQFTCSEAQVYDYIQNHTTMAEHMSIRQLASASYTSTGSVMRMIRKLGFTGYAEFQYRMRTMPDGNIIYSEEERDCRLSRYFEATVRTETYQRSVKEAAALIAGKKEILFDGDSYGRCVLETGIHLFSSPLRKAGLLKQDGCENRKKASVIIEIMGRSDPYEASSTISRIPAGTIPVIMICCGGYIPEIPCRKIICRETDEYFSKAASLIPAVHTLEMLRKTVDSAS